MTLLHAESDVEPAVAWREAREALSPVHRLDVLALALLRYDAPYNAPPAPPTPVSVTGTFCGR